MGIAFEVDESSHPIDILRLGKHPPAPAVITSQFSKKEQSQGREEFYSEESPVNRSTSIPLV